jgi:hypothetical protein
MARLRTASLFTLYRVRPKTAGGRAAAIFKISGAL